ncbi:class I tRNA ligase family protein [Saccharothrix sp. Mg75]|uniref:class I tRNA ligase family protein n=1 Tax=Saccharothrix sp. Mg75 TaxID=3445357 RepID=UPI003EE8B217
MARVYVTTSTGRRLPDLGYALGAVQADVLARHHRMRGDKVRFLTGTVGAGGAFAALREPLALSTTDFLDGDDPRHAAGVERLRRATGDASRHVERVRGLAASGALRIAPTGPPPAGPDTPGDPDDPGEGHWGPLTSLGYAADGPNFRRWWLDGDRRVHVVGRAELGFHALTWPALLLSAGLPTPTDVLVHDDLAGSPLDPLDLAARYGADAVRWWLLREASADPAASRLVTAANRDLAGTLGKTVDRAVTMVHRYRDGRPPASTTAAPGADRLTAACRDAPDLVHEALTDFDFPRAIAAVWRVVEESDRFAAEQHPWDLARAERAGDRGAGARLDAVLAALLTACRTLATQLTPFVPALADRIAGQSSGLSGALALPQVLFPRR